MKTHLVLILALGLTTMLGQAGIVELQSLKKDERVTVRVDYSEPAIRQFLHVFENQAVAICEVEKSDKPTLSLDDLRNRLRK